MTTEHKGGWVWPFGFWRVGTLGDARVALCDDPTGRETSELRYDDQRFETRVAAKVRADALNAARAGRL